MKIRAEYRHFNFPYLYDGETQSVTQAYGAQATPHIFIFDRERKLRYEGRIDNSQRESLVKIQDARAALDALLDGKQVAIAHTPAFGCSTKWKSKIDGAGAGDARSRSRAREGGPGRRRRFEDAAFQSHRQGAGGEFLGYLVRAVPDRVSGARGNLAHVPARDFDLVTVAANFPDEKTGVLKTLQQLHAGSRNLLFGSDDTYAMQAAFDAKWDGGVPFTMVIAPGGKVLFQQQGELDLLAMRRIVQANLENETYIGHPGYWAAR